MDMILTGRPVDATEALRMGLANRVVPARTAREAAEEMAAAIASFPTTCMRSDRISARSQWGAPTLRDAMAQEFRLGAPALKECTEGAGRFARGAGRSGSFKDFQPKAKL
mmetsp:Transcript_35540/g.85603  ORF Transcript_35540/g.85603 Transcript_35540/m.85603 type:complete len:110 (-) Transcript_35540:28-357(-)